MRSVVSKFRKSLASCVEERGVEIVRNTLWETQDCLYTITGVALTTKLLILENKFTYMYVIYSRKFSLILAKVNQGLAFVKMKVKFFKVAILATKTVNHQQSLATS